MPAKTNGAEFLRFYDDPKYWPENSGVYHEDEIFRVNGEAVEDDFDMSTVAATAVVEIEGGIVLDSPLYKKKAEPSLEAYFLRWKKEQTTVSLVVECPKDKVDAIKNAVRAAGGKAL